jgi:alkyl hydroperoxide reductase subunit AhpC
LSLGRNFDELYRVVVALQAADEFGVALPADWEPEMMLSYLQPFLAESQKSAWKAKTICIAMIGSSAQKKSLRLKYGCH